VRQGISDWFSPSTSKAPKSFEIDYYDQHLKCHSPDPSDPKMTRRAITLMLASEY